MPASDSSSLCSLMYHPSGASGRTRLAQNELSRRQALACDMD
jgi:hypothetical protein